MKISCQDFFHSEIPHSCFESKFPEVIPREIFSTAAVVMLSKETTDNQSWKLFFVEFSGSKFSISQAKTISRLHESAHFLNYYPPLTAHEVDNFSYLACCHMSPHMHYMAIRFTQPPSPCPIILLPTFDPRPPINLAIRFIQPPAPGPNKPFPALGPWPPINLAIWAFILQKLYTNYFQPEF